MAVFALAVASFLAVLGSYAVALTALMISPMLLAPAIAAVAMLRWGRSLWPGLVAGDLVGQVMKNERALWLLLATVVLHLAVALVATTWMRHSHLEDADLGAVLRYVRILMVVAVVAAIVLTGLIAVHDSMPLEMGLVHLFGWSTLADVSGFLVGGGLMLAWFIFPGGASAPLGDPVAIVGTALVVAVAIPGFGWGVAAFVPLALLGALALAARTGARWGTLGMAAIATTAILGASRDLAPFGGLTPGEQASNVMWAVSLFALGALMLAGYRHSDAGMARPAGMVAILFGVFMVVAGISGVAVNQMAIAHDTPFVNSGLLALGAGLGLLMLRLARRPPTPTTRWGFWLAVIAGAIYIINLVLFLQAVPLIGSAPSTALSMTAPLAVVVLAIVVQRALPSGGVVVAVAMIVAGAVVYASGITWNTAGVVLALASAWVFAASLIFMNLAIPRSNVTDVALIAAFASAAVALPIGLVVEGAGAFSFTGPEVGALALGALGANLVPQLGRTWAMAQIGPSPVGAIGVLAPTVTILLSMWLLSNPIDTGAIGGLALIISGAVIAALGGTRGKHGTDGANAGALEGPSSPTPTVAPAT